jgi:hypothetical protein
MIQPDWSATTNIRTSSDAGLDLRRHLPQMSFALSGPVRRGESVEYPNPLI